MLFGGVKAFYWSVLDSYFGGTFFGFTFAASSNAF